MKARFDELVNAIIERILGKILAKVVAGDFDARMDKFLEDMTADALPLG